MARTANKHASTVDEQEEMTVIVLKFKGGSDSLSRGFEAISQALAAAQLGGPQPQARLGRTRSAPADPIELEKDVDSPEDSEDEFVEDAVPKAQRSTNLQPRKRHTPKFDSTLDLTLGESLKTYCTTKNPASEADRYLVSAGWLTEQGGRPKFKANDLFTCFRAMGWGEQKDFTQPMRLLAAKKSYFESLGKGVWTLTPLGLSVAKEVSNKS